MTSAAGAVPPAIDTTRDDALLADFYARHWLEMGVTIHHAVPDWRATTMAFLAEARRSQALAGFVATQGGQPIGGACCHLAAPVFPAFRDHDRGLRGYIWNVFVVPAHRGHGVGTALLHACLSHLEAAGCRRVSLHAGERSRPLYERFGFTATDELALTLPRRPGL